MGSNPIRAKELHMIHSTFIQSLSGDEALLFHAVCEHTFNCLGLQGKPAWYQMMRPEVLASRIMHIQNLKEEYHPVAQSLSQKLKEYKW